MMLTISDKCIRCGRCVAVCPSMIIEMMDGFPFIREAREKGCIVCGHCVSVCPEAALDHRLTPLSSQIESDRNPVADPETTSRILRSVRSVRNYKSKPVDPSLIRRMADTARYVPTGRNTQGVSFIAVMNPGKVRALSDRVVDWMAEMLESGADWAKVYKGIVAVQRGSGRDMIFRGAPHLLLALAEKSNGYGVDNARLGMVYARTEATALGLGTCWAGFFEFYAKARPAEVAEFLDLPEELQIGASVMVGYPKYEYRRLVERNPLKIEFR